MFAIDSVNALLITKNWKMGTSEETIVKQEEEEMEYFIDQVGPEDQQDPLSGAVHIKSEDPDSCMICPGPNKVPFSWEHVLERHGLNDVEYRDIAKALEAPKAFEHSVFTSTKAGDDKKAVDDNYEIRDLIVNECTFKCKYCDQKRSSWQQMSMHIYRTHNDVKKSEKGARSLDPFDLVVEHKIFECPKCKKPILHDKQLIRRHFREAHKILLPKPIQVKVKRSKGKVQRVPQRRGLVTNECKFKCKYCPKIFASWHTNVMHHRTIHKSLGKFVTKPSEAVFESKFHTCSDCGKEILKDNRIVRSHMRNYHYGKRDESKNNKSAPKNPILVTNECKFKCKYCPKVLDTWGSAILHHRKNHKPQGKLPLPSDAAIECKFQPCKLCGQEVLKDNRLIYYHMRNVHGHGKEKLFRRRKRVTKNPKLVVNECKFKCKYCQKVFESWQTMRFHHTINHKSLGKFPSPQDVVIECKFHKCNLCGKEVLKDNRIIRNHMHNHDKKLENDKSCLENAKPNPSKSKSKYHGLVVNECKFQCKYCPEAFESWKSTEMHHDTNHKSLGDMSIPSDSLISARYHICCLCGEKVLKDDHLVSLHIGVAHNLTAISYKKWAQLLDKGEKNEKVLLSDPKTNGCTFRCIYCEQEYTIWTKLTRHMAEKHNPSGTKMRHDPFKLVVDHKIFECNECRTPILQDRSLIYSHMHHFHRKALQTMQSEAKDEKNRARSSEGKEDNKVVPKMGWLVINECKFRCTHCPKTFESWDSTLYHHRTTHKSLTPAPPLPDDSIIESKFHTCCLCEAQVFKDNRLIYDHIRVAHNLTTTLYKRWLNLKFPDKKSEEEAAKECESVKETEEEQSEQLPDQEQQQSEEMDIDDIGREAPSLQISESSSPPMRQDPCPKPNEGTDHVEVDGSLFPLRRAGQKRDKSRSDSEEDDAWFGKYKQLKRCRVVVRDVKKTGRFEVGPKESVEEHDDDGTEKEQSEDLDASQDDSQNADKTRGENSENQTLDIEKRVEECEIIAKTNVKSETVMSSHEAKIANDSDAQFGNLVANCLRDSNLSMVQKLALQGEILGLIASKIK